MSKLQSNWKSSIDNGEYRRKGSQFRHWITADGSAGTSGEAGFKAEAGRYHLYVSLACPWAHRTLVFRQLKELEQLITVSVVHPDMHDKGWIFKHNEESAALYDTTGDTLYGADYMSEHYFSQTDDTKVISLFQFYGIRKKRSLLTTNPVKLFACLTRRLMILLGINSIFIPKSFAVT